MSSCRNVSHYATHRTDTIIVTANTTGSLAVNAGAEIAASNGSVSLENSNISGTIAIGANATIVGTGQVEIYINSTTSVAGTTPTNVTALPSNGGAILFGSNSSKITASSPQNYVSANGAGASVMFNATTTTSSITLGGGDSITAISFDGRSSCAETSELIVDTGEDSDDLSEEDSVVSASYAIHP